MFLEVASNPSILSSEPSAGATLMFGYTIPLPASWPNPNFTGFLVSPNNMSSADSVTIFVNAFLDI